MRAGGAGVVYDASFYFEGGGRFVSDIYMILGGFSLSMPADAAEPTFPTHDVNLFDPMPDKVKSLFKFLDEPWQNVAGSVWIAEQGKQPRIEHNANLVAR